MIILLMSITTARRHIAYSNDDGGDGDEFEKIKNNYRMEVLIWQFLCAQSTLTINAKNWKGKKYSPAIHNTYSTEAQGFKPANKIISTNKFKTM